MPTCPLHTTAISATHPCQRCRKERPDRDNIIARNPRDHGTTQQAKIPCKVHGQWSDVITHPQHPTRRDRECQCGACMKARAVFRDDKQRRPISILSVDGTAAFSPRHPWRLAPRPIMRPGSLAVEGDGSDPTSHIALTRSCYQRGLLFASQRGCVVCFPVSSPMACQLMVVLGLRSSKLALLTHLVRPHRCVLSNAHSPEKSHSARLRPELREYFAQRASHLRGPQCRPIE